MQISILTEKECSSIKGLIETSNNIVICCHVNPDGDAIGSSLALAEYLRIIGKEPLVTVPDMYPDFLHWLPGSENIVRYDKHKEIVEKAFANADLVFCLDFNCESRLESMGDVLANCKADKILIDHHPDPDVKCNIAVSHPEASSTCELEFRVLWQLGAFDSLNIKVAQCLYCGMMTDTGGFTYNSTSPEIFFIISQLLTKGIDKDKIYRNVYNNYSQWRLRLTGYILYKKMKVYDDFHTAYYTLTRGEMSRFFFKRGDAEGLVNMPLQIKGIKLSISLREDTEKDNLVWVSLRSVDDFSCIDIAQAYFNGGGHFNASGGRLTCSIEEAENIVKMAMLHFEKQLKK